MDKVNKAKKTNEEGKKTEIQEENVMQNKRIYSCKYFIQI